MARFSVIPTIGLALLVGACGQDEVTTSPEAVELAPVAQSVFGGPLNPGQSMVYRFETTDVWVAINGERTLLSINGAGTTDLPSSILCGGAEYDAWPVQDAFNRTLNRISIGQEVHQIIMALPADCSHTPLAVGTGQFKLHDNDVFYSGTRMNSWGWNAQGILHDPVTGDPYQYLENQLFVAAPGFPPSPRWINETITLTPIGN